MEERKPTLCVVAGPNGSGKTITTELNGGHEVPISKVISRYFKSLELARQAITFVDRAYVYDNSVEDTLPQLLYRTSEGNVVKRYTDDIPEWAQILV